MCAFFSELELSVRGKDRELTEGQAMHLYECKAVLILSHMVQTGQPMLAQARDSEWYYQQWNPLSFLYLHLADS
jgi:hypothetical protein